MSIYILSNIIYAVFVVSTHFINSYLFRPPGALRIQDRGPGHGSVIKETCVNLFTLHAPAARLHHRPPNRRVEGAASCTTTICGSE